MRITRVEAWPVNMRLVEPYTIAYETVEHVANVFVRIETNRNVVGYGCAAPDEHVTGETAAGAARAFDDIVGPSLRGSDPLRYVRLLERLKDALGKQPSVLAAVDMALHDIMGRVAGIPVWKLLGGFRDRIKTSVTVGILPLEQTVMRSRDWVQRGFRCLKLKGGVDVEDDCARIVAVRAAVGPKSSCALTPIKGIRSRTPCGL